MADIKPSAADEVRRLTRAGLLAEDFRTAGADRRRYLRAGAAEIAGPLLFLRLTRQIERNRGHHRCAAGLHQLEPDCLDRYHDDLDAVLDHLFAHANGPIENLEGWLTSRLPQATVDGNRRRRGERGALQRPRVTVWLARALDDDPWLIELATAILDWAGSDATAGGSPWPLNAWSARRASFVGDHEAGEAVVARDVETVLAAMRGRPEWYEKYVERPLGRKRAPVWVPSRGDDGAGRTEPQPLALPPHERVEALLRQLAADAIELMQGRIEQGEDPAVVADEVLRSVFGGMPASDAIDQPPGAAETGVDQVIALIDDPERLNRIVAAVRRLLGRPSEP